MNISLLYTHTSHTYNNYNHYKKCSYYTKQQSILKIMRPFSFFLILCCLFKYVIFISCYLFFCMDWYTIFLIIHNNLHYHINDVGGKSPRLWYLRIAPCYALPQFSPIFAYRGIIIPLLCSYRGGSQGLSPTYEQAHVGLDLLTLVSYHIIIYEAGGQSRIAVSVTGNMVIKCNRNGDSHGDKK